jgi:hypothetical protein
MGRFSSFPHVLLLILVICLTGHSAAAQVYSCTPGKYEVEFPGIPQLSMDTVETDAGNVILYSALVTPNQEEAFLVVYSDYSHELVSMSDAYSIINAAKEGALGNFKAKTVHEKKITLINYPGLEFDAVSDQFTISYKMFMAGDRLFQVGYISLNKSKTHSDFRKFLDTFKIKSE